MLYAFSSCVGLQGAPAARISPNVAKKPCFLFCEGFMLGFIIGFCIGFYFHDEIKQKALNLKTKYWK